MEELDNLVWKKFGVYPKHMSFLEKINENTSQALRTVLDSTIRSNDKNEKKQKTREFLIFTCFGLLFFIIALTAIYPYISMMIALATGAGILVYGLIGGIENALPRTRR